MSDLPAFLKITRRRRGETARPVIVPGVDSDHWGSGAVPLGGQRPGNGPNNSDGGGALTAPETRPRRVGAEPPEQSLEDLGIPADAEQLAKVSEVAGVDENYSSTSEPGTLRPRRATGPAPLPSDESVEPTASVEPQPPAPGVEYDPTRSAARERFADPAGRLEKQVVFEQQNPASDRDGKLKTFFKEFGEGLLQGGLFGGVARGVRGLADPSVNERRGQQRRVGRYQRDLAGMRAQQKERLALDDQRASTRQKNAQAGYYEQRPDIEAAKRADGAEKAERARIFRVLSSMKGQKLDPSNSRHAKLIADADAAGVPLDAESFNNSKGNVIRYVRTDPEHPERTVEVERNVVTGEETVLGQKGYQATRGVDGRTTAEVKSDEDRDTTRANTQEYRKQLLAQSTDRLHLQMSNGLGTQAKRIFDTRTHGLFEQRRQFETQINGLRTRSSKKEIPPADAERRIEEIQKKVDGLTEQIDDARSEALGSMGAPAGAAHVGGTHVSRVKFKDKYPQFKDRPDVEVDAAIRSSGYEPMP